MQDLHVFIWPSAQFLYRWIKIWAGTHILIQMDQNLGRYPYFDTDGSQFGSVPGTDGSQYGAVPHFGTDGSQFGSVPGTDGSQYGAVPHFGTDISLQRNHNLGWYPYFGTDGSQTKL